MIFVNYSGRLGNNLFQYAAAYCLAVMSKQQLHCSMVPGFFDTAFHGNGELMEPSPDAIRTFKHGEPWPASVNLFDYAERAARGQDVIIGGHPHRTSYYEPFRVLLHDKLKPNEGRYCETGPNDFVVNVRIGDFFLKGMERFRYDLAIFQHILRALSWERLVVVTDEPKHEFIASLVEEFGAEVFHGMPMEDYRTLYHAHRFVMSPSSFCWWPAFLGNAHEVWMPWEHGSWKASLGFGLEIHDKRIIKFG